MQQKIGVRFKLGSKVYSFLSEDIELKIGDFVIVETSIGQGFGKVEKIEELLEKDAENQLKKVIRKATKEDEEQNEKMLEKERTAINITKELVENMKLDMIVVNAEYSFDGSKVIIDFISDNRVDFRDLVKELASKLKARIELRQIGIRDQAKMVGGIGICGRMCCCSSYLKDFEKVSIKMAKSQGLALNPTKISGSCGRLMCCLAYEDNYYSEVYPKLPKINKDVKTPDGIGCVLYTNALKQIVSVKITANDGSSVIKDYKLDDIKLIEQNEKNNFSNNNYEKSAEKSFENNLFENIENNEIIEDKIKNKTKNFNNKNNNFSTEKNDKNFENKKFNKNINFSKKTESKNESDKTLKIQDNKTINDNKNINGNNNSNENRKLNENKNTNENNKLNNNNNLNENSDRNVNKNSKNKNKKRKYFNNKHDNKNYKDRHVNNK